MFDKLKQIKEFRDQAKAMQAMLADVSIIEGSESKVLVTMNGNMEITSLIVNGQAFSDDEALANELTSVINRAIKEGQKKSAEVMRTSGMFNIPGLT